MAKERKSNAKIKTGIFFMALGLLLVAAAGGLFAYNRIIDKNAGEAAQKIIATVERAPVEESFTEDENGEKSVVIDGDKYIGVISIPALSINLPVQSEWSLAAAVFMTAQQLSVRTIIRAISVHSNMPLLEKRYIIQMLRVLHIPTK